MLNGDITGWSGQQIIDFLLKYPTPIKATLAGANTLDTYYRAACTDTGVWFLPIHAENRLKAGDKAEYDAIMAVVARCQQILANAQAAVDSSQSTAQPVVAIVQPQPAQTVIVAGTVPPTMQPTVPAPAGTPGAPTFTVTESDYLPPFLQSAAQAQQQQSVATSFLGMSPVTWLMIGAAAYFLFRR